MSITSYQQTRAGEITTVTVTSDLSGTVWFHWYLDGIYVGGGQSPSREFFLPVAEQARVEVVDTTNPAFDPIAGAPSGWPARRTLWWVRSLAADVDQYRVEQKKGSGSWTTIALIPHDPLAWSYSVLSGRLDDLADYQWRVVPIDAAGNDGTPIALDTEHVVRTPDAPDFTISFDSGTDKITFSEAA